MSGKILNLFSCYLLILNEVTALKSYAVMKKLYIVVLRDENWLRQCQLA